MDLSADELEILVELFLLVLADRDAEGGSPIRVDEVEAGLGGDAHEIGRLAAILDHLQSSGEVEVSTDTAEIVLLPEGHHRIKSMYRHSMLVVAHAGLVAEMAAKSAPVVRRASEDAG